MSIARQHAEWLSLIEVSGPFVSLPVLMHIFPQGLDKEEHEPEARRLLRMAYEEWADNQAGLRPNPAIHREWLRFVLANALEMPPEALAEGPALPAGARAYLAEHGETLLPDMALVSPHDRTPRLLIKLYPAGQDLDKPLPGVRWKASPATRMMELLRHSGVRLGLLTNGEHWMLVDAPQGETTGFASWYAALWLDEPLTLRAFYNLLGARRFFGVPDDETIEAMLSESAKNQQEVTEQLGYQVRRAVEMLVQSLDRIDKDRGRVLLQHVTETSLYEAALTFMMRLVFLLSAEERGLLLLGELLYDRHYAVSTLQAQLREQADQFGEEVLERRHDAWSRLLATFRVVYGGVEHQDLRLPAYGGHLFDPDRYPFLEGRAPGTSWHATPAEPLAINNRTVLHLLEALQYLQVKVQGGGPAERRRLSFRALDVEQIGHVYEGLLDHTARRAAEPVLGLSGSIANESEVALARLEVLAARGQQPLLDFLAEQTGRSASAIGSALANSPILRRFSRADLMSACDNDAALFERVLPFAGLLRFDTFGRPVVIAAGSVYVTQGSVRRATGTHYTPRSLTEPIVQHALDPLVYSGPAEGLPPEDWQLRPAADILKLKVCDFAMGSGAFLVQVCRYLAEKLVEAWENALPIVSASSLPGQLALQPQITPEGLPSSGDPGETLLPADEKERLALAMRLVAERCVYGVDKNPLAVEMAKLSLWLITLSKNKPFTFLDHALRSSDSLLGVNLRQLTTWSMDGRSGKARARQMTWIEPLINDALATALRLRRRIRAMPERDARDLEIKTHLLAEAEEAMELVRLGADLLVATALCYPKRQMRLQDTIHVDYTMLASASQEAREQGFTEAGKAEARAAYMRLRRDVDDLLHDRHPFHWPLEFPEVFAAGPEEERGFSAIISNPPFQGGQKITGALGTDYRDYLVVYLANGTRGSADLCAYFFLRAGRLVREGGMGGLLATNTIAQGDTREVGLDQLVAIGWSIPRAVPSSKWPGEASLEIAHVWLHHGNWHGLFKLNDRPVEGISAFLTPKEAVQGKPYRLAVNADKSFQGSIVLGMGFVLESQVALALIEKNTRNRDVLYPYLNGEDLNSRPDQSPSRWVINFHDWPLERAEMYEDCLKIVREKVKPQREQQKDKIGKDIWWRFLRIRPELYSTIAGMERVLVIALNSRTCAFTFVPTNIVFSHTTDVFAFDKFCYLALLQSSFHVEWAFNYASSLKGDLRYTSTDCFENYPFPPQLEELESIGESFYQYRQFVMQKYCENLTRLYNRFHNPEERAEEISKLRALHREMDEVVASAYGWDDLALGHGFHETKQGLRYTISEKARREVLGRLLRLNHERYAEEVTLGLHVKGAKNGRGRSKGKREARMVDEGVQGELVFE
jgi:Eco57I restriction-modification methylase/MmeI, target recognition domain/MmeI, N-terminal domain